MQALTPRTGRLTPRRMRDGGFPPHAALMAAPHAASACLFCHDAAGWPIFGHGALLDRQETGETAGLILRNAGALFPELRLGWLLRDGDEAHVHSTGGAAEHAAATRPEPEDIAVRQRRLA